MQSKQAGHHGRRGRMRRHCILTLCTMQTAGPLFEESPCSVQNIYSVQQACGMAFPGHEGKSGDGGEDVS